MLVRGEESLQVLAHIEAVDEVLVAANTELVNGVGVGQSDELNLLEGH